MIDIHLINVVLASLGISAGAVVLIAAAVITLAAVGRRRAVPRPGQLTRAPAKVPTSAPNKVPATVRADAPVEESGGPGQTRREPALR